MTRHLIQLSIQISVLLGVALASTGCYTMNASMPGTLRQDVKPDQVEKVGTLDYEETHWFFLAGLIGAPEEDFFEKEIKKQVQARGADGVANLRYEAQNGCFNILVNYCTCQIIAPRTYHITGDIVRIKTAPLPGNPVKGAGGKASQEPSSPPVAAAY